MKTLKEWLKQTKPQFELLESNSTLFAKAIRTKDQKVFSSFVDAVEPVHIEEFTIEGYVSKFRDDLINVEFHFEVLNKNNKERRVLVHSVSDIEINEVENTFKEFINNYINNRKSSLS